MHLSVADWSTLRERPTDALRPEQIVGVSCHSVEELECLPFRPDYAYVSPVAASISKPGYGNDSLWTRELRRAVTARFPFPLIALGGVGEANAQGFIEEGFAGVALLGYFASQQLYELTERVQKLCAPTLLLCGGIDPTAEAGLTADMQHAARLGVRAYSIVTALTCQDAVTFTRLTAVADTDLIEAVRALRRQSPPQVAKIGLIASLHQLRLLIREIRVLFPACRIVWDPILRTSSGADLLPDARRESLLEVAELVDVILPNRYESRQLFGEITPGEWAKHTATAVIAKSAFCTEEDVTDRAYLPDGRLIESTAPRLRRRPPWHGLSLRYDTVRCLSSGRRLPRGTPRSPACDDALPPWAKAGSTRKATATRPTDVRHARYHHSGDPRADRPRPSSGLSGYRGATHEGRPVGDLPPYRTRSLSALSCLQRPPYSSMTE